MCIIVGGIFLFFDDGDVGVYECVCECFHHGEVGFVGFVVEVVEEDAPNASVFVSVGEIEVVVAFGFEGGVIVGIGFVAGRFVDGVEMGGIFWVEIVGCEVCTAAEPPNDFASRFDFEVAVIGVCCGDEGVFGMDD